MCRLLVWSAPNDHEDWWLVVQIVIGYSGWFQGLDGTGTQHDSDSDAGPYKPPTLGITYSEVSLKPPTSEFQTPAAASCRWSKAHEDFQLIQPIELVEYPTKAGGITLLAGRVQGEKGSGSLGAPREVVDRWVWLQKGS